MATQSAAVITQPPTVFVYRCGHDATAEVAPHMAKFSPEIIRRVLSQGPCPRCSANQPKALVREVLAAQSRPPKSFRKT